MKRRATDEPAKTAKKAKPSLAKKKKKFQHPTIAIERKFYDTSLVSANIASPTDATGGEQDPSATSMITTPAQGDGEQNRDGKQIICDFVEITGNVIKGALETQPNPELGTRVYLACVLDTQSNGAQLNSEDVYKNTGASQNLATAVQRNLLFGKRFKILKKEVFDFNPFIGATGANDFASNAMSQSFNWFIPLNNLKINFNAGTTASIANVIDNSIHMIAFSNQTTPQQTLSYNARLRFYG